MALCHIPTNGILHLTYLADLPVGHWRVNFLSSPDLAYIQRDQVMLPALKQTMGNKAIERRKRTQILQKSRQRREVLHWHTPLTPTRNYCLFTNILWMK